MAAVLFTDDQVELLRLIEKKLEGAPFKVYTAQSAMEAIEILRTVEINVIVTDIIMPQMNGVELLKVSKALQPLAMRVVLSSSNYAQTIIAAVDEGEAFHYILKPWRVDEHAIDFLKNMIAFSKRCKRSMGCGKSMKGQAF
jgi:DNA-binding NtrC family response regulator